MRILGIDWGEKQVGLSISEGFLANEYMTLKVKNIDETIEEIKEICEDETIGKIVIGLPLSLDLQEHAQAKIVKDFAQKLKEKTNCEIILEDETLTTFEAEDILKSEGATPDEMKELVDRFSAKLILQQYLERQAK